MESINGKINTSVRMNSSGKSVSEELIDEEWQEIQAAQKDPALFRPLYDRYYDGVFRYIFRRTTDEHLTADICSQVFLKAMQHLPDYRFQGVPFSAWLFRIASNEIAQHFRQARKQRVVSLDTPHVQRVMSELEVDWDPARERHHIQSLVQALDSLKPRDLELIELRFFEHRPFKEIAAILEITESNAKVRTYRLLEKMKKKIFTHQP